MKKTIKHQGFRLALLSLLVYEAMGVANANPQWICSASADGSGWRCQQGESTSNNLPGVSAAQANLGKIAQSDRVIERTQQKVIQDLGWVTTGKCEDNLCGGYYEAVVLPPPPADTEQVPVRIEADDSSFSQTGLSQLQGNVVISRASGQLAADTVYLARDPNTKEFSVADAYGNVVIQQPGFLAIGTHAQTNIQNNTGYLENVLYRMPRLSKYGQMQLASTPISDVNTPEYVKIYGMTGWGRADSVVQQEDGVIIIRNGSYTTCVPSNEIWELTASRLDLDNKEGIGEAYHAKLRYKGVPVFYFPYYRFPLNDERHTGFLMPQPSYSSDNGFQLGTPFYWNIAPNYDATITPVLYTERGLQVNAAGRWLTENSEGSIAGGVLPDDQEFAKFQHDAKTDYAGNPNLNDLEGDSSTRSFFAVQNATRLNQNWLTTVDYNYVSDDYYLEDFGLTPQEASENQLLRQADLSYKNTNIYFLTRLQAYQTLQPVNQPGVITQYERLPEIDLNFNYPDSLPYGLTFSQQNQFVYFEHDNDINEETGQPFVTGSRVNVQPGLALPMVRPGGFVTPRLQLQGTFYDLSNPGTSFNNVDDVAVPTTDGNPSNPTRVLPIFNIDSGLYFDRDMELFGGQYRQTLEPRFMYLYVPYEDQQDMPLFDTSLPMFTYNSLWSTNRFSGIDRVGDANQVSLGVTSRFLDSETGTEKLRGSIGQIVYLQDREVTLCGDDGCAGTNYLLGEENQSPLDSMLSPVTGELLYRLTDSWHIRTGGAYTYDGGDVNNAYFGFQYQPDDRRILNIGYQFIRGGDVDTVNKGAPPSNDSSRNDYNRPDFSVVWPIYDQWSFVGRYNYNISHGYQQAYFYGLQYSNCCWSMRVIQSRYEDGINNDNNVQYSNDILVEFSLHGLGALGSGQSSALLEEGIPGYIDRFGQPY